MCSGRLGVVVLDADLEPSKPEAGETSLPARKGGISEPRVSGVSRNLGSSPGTAWTSLQASARLRCV